MRLVGFTSGTGYLCQRDTLGRMRGLFGERRSGMAGWFSDLPTQVSGATGGAATGASVGIMAGPVGSAAGTILGAVIGAGTSLYAANQQASAAYRKANMDAATALRAQGAYAQQQAAQSVQQQVAVQSFTKTAVVSIAAIGGVALAGFLIYRMMRKKS